MSSLTSHYSGPWLASAAQASEHSEDTTMKFIEKITVFNRLGLHLRTGVELARVANGFKSIVTVSNGARTVSAKSLLDLLTIGAIYGTVLEFYVEGDNASEAIEAIRLLVQCWQKENSSPLKFN